MSPEEMAAIIGRNIKSLRSRKNLSSEALAAMLSERTGTKITGRAIRNYEAGGREPSIWLINQIADLFDCSAQTIIAGAEDTAPLVYRRLSAEESRILRFLATEWEGDVAALITMMGVYAMLPASLRSDAQTVIMAMAQMALSTGDISDSDLPEGYKRLKERWWRHHEHTED